MYIKMTDGQVEFATHFVYVNLTKEQKYQVNFCQLEKDGIVCYSDEEKDNIVNKLKELNITYTIEELNHDPVCKEKCKDLKYNSRSEAIKHLLDDMEPECQKIPNLMKRLEQKEKELTDTKLEMENMKKLFKNLDERMKRAKI